MSDTTFRLKRSSVQGKIPTTGQLDLGEVAINTYDGRMFIKKDDGTASVIQVGGIDSTSFDSATKTFTITTTDSSFSTILNFAQPSDINAAIAAIVDGAPSELNTLNEIATAINANRINVYNASGSLLN